MSTACRKESKHNQSDFSVTGHLFLLSHSATSRESKDLTPAACTTRLEGDAIETLNIAHPKAAQLKQLGKPAGSRMSQGLHCVLLTSHFRSVSQTFRALTFCSMVLCECFFLGFGAFLVVPRSAALSSKQGIRPYAVRTTLEHS